MRQSGVVVQFMVDKMGDNIFEIAIMEAIICNFIS
jgi:hypothetical protein